MSCRPVEGPIHTFPPKEDASKSSKKRSGPDSNGSEDGTIEKKIKTARACDSCRRKKIKCKPFEPDDLKPSLTPPTCLYCSNHNIRCTWFLPISETRWKSKGGKPPTLAEQRQRTTSVSHETPPSNSFGSVPSLSQTSSSLQLPSSSSLIAEAFGNTASHGTPSASSEHGRSDLSLLGPTSGTHLPMPTSPFPSEKMTSRHLRKYDVNEAEGDGFIKVFQQREFPQSQDEWNTSDDAVTPSTIEQLVNVFLNTHAPLFPILSRSDFLASSPLEPHLLWAMTGVAAASHRVPDYVLRSIKKNISLVARESDVLSVISLQAVQAHLLFSLSMEMERSTAGAKVFNSCGLAIRMAQSMGLHRENGMKETDLDISHLELRRRTWGGCVIADRWISAMYGLPQMIDLQDCDRLFPSEHQLLPKQEAVDDKSKPFLGNPAMIELSILLGNVLKLVYSPTGLAGVTDQQLQDLRGSIQEWRRQLPNELQFLEPTAGCLPVAGFLAIAYVPVLFLLYRPFLNPLNCHRKHGIQFFVSQSEFAELVHFSARVIQWIDVAPYILESWSIALYGFFFCALIQYHQYVRYRDAAPLESLRLAVSILSRIHNAACSSRSKIAELVTILEHIATSLNRAQGPIAPPQPSEDPVCNGWSSAPQSRSPHSATSSVSAYQSIQPHEQKQQTFTPGDPDLPFTFVQGADFMAPGPLAGPLSWDMPTDLTNDADQWQVLMHSLQEASSQPMPTFR